ncbi:hypothetical protein MPH_10310 [Macrophomina phaseolina MS6]|uniref:Uncharacterized protein n=1 Tax=Macrophomina phaseolina (strain MS6) TaxID=1126212 RepID=K2S6R7_MACPH|nr:hypothetical protein MPH_10310 [Macrophomina phaseolina MS6]
MPASRRISSPRYASLWYLLEKMDAGSKPAIPSYMPSLCMLASSSFCGVKHCNTITFGRPSKVLSPRRTTDGVTDMATPHLRWKENTYIDTSKEAFIFVKVTTIGPRETLKHSSVSACPRRCGAAPPIPHMTVI